MLNKLFTRRMGHQDRGDEQTFQLGTRDEGTIGPNVQ